MGGVVVGTARAERRHGTPPGVIVMDPPALPSQLPELLRDLSQPARRLRDAGCCGFCVLRLVGATEHASYQQPPAVVERLLDEHVGGRPGGTVRSEEAVRTQQIASSALAASGATSDRRIRAFVTTRDPSLFSGAKLVQIVATDPVALRKSLAEAIGHPNVPLGVKLNARSALTSVDAVRALGENPRLEVSRSVTPVQPGAANAHEAAADNGEPSVAKAGTAPAVETIGSPATQEDYLGSTFVCCACLGILQRAGADASEMIASVHRDGWECPTGQRVVLGIAIPSDVLVRQRLLVMVGFPMAPPVRRPIELKEAMLWLFEKVLQQELKCELVPAMVQETGDYGMSILLGWKAAAGVLSDARRVAVRYGAASYRAQPSRKRHRAEKGSDRNSSDVDTSWQTIAKLLTSVDTMRLRDVCEFPPRKPLKCISPMEMKIHRPSIYVAGRYMKFERGLSQTPWAYAEPGATSVQEVISNVLAPHFRPDKATFTSGGREDMDVRMLGTGRPFAFIMENPRVLAPSVSTQHIAAAQNDVNHQAVGRYTRDPHRF